MISIAERLAQGEIILIDGGMGTELEKRGVPMNDHAWSAMAVGTHPDMVRQVHGDYIKAGADVIITNTFATSRHMLAVARHVDQFEVLNDQAVKLACQAREDVADRPIWVAGSISTETMSREQPPPAEAKANFEAQADILAAAGADLIVLEMMRDTEYTRIALQAAARTGLPIWVGFSCHLEDDGSVNLFNRTYTLAEGLAAIAGQAGSLVAVMHTLTEEITPALQVVKESWSGPIGAYAHSGDFIMPNWQFIDMISPEDYAAEAQTWVEMGVQVIGGCCGIGPAHIKRLKEDLPTQLPQERH